MTIATDRLDEIEARLDRRRFTDADLRYLLKVGKAADDLSEALLPEGQLNGPTRYVTPFEPVAALRLALEG